MSDPGDWRAGSRGTLGVDVRRVVVWCGNGHAHGGWPKNNSPRTTTTGAWQPRRRRMAASARPGRDKVAARMCRHCGNGPDQTAAHPLFSLFIPPRSLNTCLNLCLSCASFPFSLSRLTYLYFVIVATATRVLLTRRAPRTGRAHALRKKPPSRLPFGPATFLPYTYRALVPPNAHPQTLVPLPQWLRPRRGASICEMEKSLPRTSSWSSWPIPLAQRYGTPQCSSE